MSFPSGKPAARSYVIVATVALVMMFLVFYFAWRAYDDNRNRILDGFNERQLLLARSIALGLETYFREIFVSLETFSAPARVLPGQDGTVPDLEQVFQGFLPRTSVRFIDSRGILRAIYPSSGWRKNLLSRDYSAEDYFRTVRETEKPAVSAVIVNEQGEERIRLAAPLLSRKGETDMLAGILVLSFDFQDVMRKFVHPLVTGQPIQVWLVSGEGRHIAFEDGERTSRSSDPMALPATMIQSVLGSREGTGRFILAGADTMTAFAPLSMGASFWSVIVASPAARFQDLIWRANRQVLFGSGFVLAILFAAASWTTGTAFRWSRSMEREVDRQTALLRKKTDFLDSLIRCANAPIVAWNPDGKIVLCNEAFEKMVGRRAGDLAGRSLENLFPEKDRGECLRAMKEASRGGIPSPGVEIPILGKNGETRTVRWMASRILEEDDEDHYTAIAHGEDITERKQAEDRLRESEERFRKIFEGGVLGMAVLGLDFRFVRVNETLCRILGAEEEDLIGRTYLDITHPDHRESDRTQVDRLLKGEIPYYKTEKRYLRENGEAVWVHVTASLIRDEQGNPRYFLAMMENIMDRKTAEEEKRNLESQLFHAQKMETLGSLVAGVAHEINNPVNKILFDIPLLRKIWHDVMPLMEGKEKAVQGAKYGGLPVDFLKENLPQLLSDMEMASNRICRTVQNLKDYTRKSSVLMEKKPVALNMAVENAVRLVETTVRKREIVLDLELAADLPLIEGDLPSVEQMVVNILLNAVQAIRHEAGRISIVTGLSPATRQVFVSIADNGGGIDSSIGERIFDPFMTTRQADGGTGLGLSITRNLAEAHGGNIAFRSEKDRGTVFTLSFPFAGPEISQ